MDGPETRSLLLSTAAMGLTVSWWPSDGEPDMRSGECFAGSGSLSEKKVSGWWSTWPGSGAKLTFGGTASAVWTVRVLGLCSRKVGEP